MEHTQEKLKVTYHLSGSFDESAVLPPILLAPTIIICLREVERLNSVGTRTWCEWIREVPADVKIYVENCPFTFINAFNDVFGSHPRNLQVRSFFVPFVSEATGERKDILFTRGQDFDSQSVKAPPTVLDSLNRRMEMDVLPGYFGFLENEKNIC